MQGKKSKMYTYKNTFIIIIIVLVALILSGGAVAMFHQV